MATIEKVRSMPATAFLSADNFRSDLDSMAGSSYGEQQYQKGLRIGRESISIHISYTNSWSAHRDGLGYVSSSEIIGYHARTAELLQGFLDSGVTLVVHRLESYEPIIIKGDKIR